MNPRVLLVGVAMLVAACGDRVDNNIQINVGNDTGPDTTLVPDTAEPDVAPDVSTPQLCAVEGGIGCPCTANLDCNSTRCIEGPDGRICTQECIESCPDGFDCTTVGGPGDGASICVPRHVSLCRPCNSRNDCRIGSDSTAHCIPAADPDEGSFCATSCASLPCPDGYSCEDLPTGEGAATAKLCVPEDDGVCACRPAWAGLGLETTCFNTNDTGTCTGTRTCAADGLTACDAPAAAPETCNNHDDDCNGTPDDIAAEYCALSTDGIASTCPGQTACRDGAEICTGRAPAHEICDGIDNDCNQALDDSTSNCLDTGCVQRPDSPTFIQNGAPACFEGGCVYANPTPCGYFTCSGAVCATACTDDSLCIANATCVSGACQCATGYAGAACELCATHYQDNDDDGVCAPACSMTACDAVGGVCDDSSGTAMCTCNEGWTGPACDGCDMPSYTDPDDLGVCARRGEVDPGPAPGEVARVGKVWHFAMLPSQPGWMPGDTFVFSLEAGPATMAIDAASGEIAWTPAPDEQTWNEDPTLSARTTVTIRATAPDGQFAEHTVHLQVLPAVFVTGMHPAAGLATGGEPMLVFGEGFVEPEGISGSIGVAFGTIPAHAVTVLNQNTLAVTTAPAPALTRPLVIVLDGDPEVDLRPGFTHLPVLDFASATAVPIGANLILTGSGHDPELLTSNQAVFASRGRSYQFIRPSELPNGSEVQYALGIGQFQPTFASGPVQMVVNGLRSNAIPLTITDSPVPGHLTVTSTGGAAAVGAALILRGAGFAGLTPADLAVDFATGPGPNDRARGTVTAINSAGTQVTVTVPTGARTGPVFMSATGRHATTSHVPVVISGTEPVPFIFDATPETVAPGEALVIRGQAFADASVRIAGIDARILSQEAHRIVVEVPLSARFGPGQLTVVTGDTTLQGPILGISGRRFELIAGGATGIGPEPSDDPFGDPVVPNALAIHPTGLVLYGDGIRVRALNRTANSITAFGATIAPGKTQTLTSGAGIEGWNNPLAFAVRPFGGDLFFVVGGSRIFRMRQSDGQVLEYAGQRATGNAGNDGPRLDASFFDPRSLAFTSNSVLVIHDTFNGPIRAINTGSSTVSLWGISLPPDIVKQVEPQAANNGAGLVIDRDDAIYFATFSQIWRIAPDRLPATDPNYVSRVRVAGAGGVGQTTGCPALTQVLGDNHYLALDPATGDIFIGSRHAVVRRIVASGGDDPERVDGNDCIENYAGLAPDAAGVPQPGLSGDGGPALQARIGLAPQPTIGRDGDLYVVGNTLSEIRRVLLRENPDERIITTIAGRPPHSLEGLNAKDLRSGVLHFAPPGVFDAARDRWLFAARQSQVIAIDRTTGRISMIAGTGRVGNRIGPDNDALTTDFGDIRGMALRDGRHLVMIETLMVRVSSIDLETGRVSVLAGDGLAATGTENTFVGPAISSRVNITTGRPRVTIGPDGMIYFGNSGFVRVINPTGSDKTTFGITVPAGHINHLPTGLGANVSRVVFDRQGHLWVASNSPNRLTVLRTNAPTTVERVIGPDSETYGRLPPGKLRDVRDVGMIDMQILPNGDMVLVPQSGHVLYHVKAADDGRIDGDSPVVAVLGTGPGGGGLMAALRPVSAQSLTPGSLELDDAGLLMTIGGSSAVRLLVDF